ncbi:alpha/beta hydrolase [Dyella sp. KRB-257]|uniref:alpha/beta hydrolase n=1 Tax=Dyella sp. KRB-257 TaxID=3400915 RepID=UPI003C09B6F2
MSRRVIRFLLSACALVPALSMHVVRAQVETPDATPGASAQTLRWRARLAEAGEPATVPPGIRVIRDVAYGSDPRQRFDVYAPKVARGAPVIFMVHGGGWRRGDKAMRGVVQNKVAYWVVRGYVVISTNYRMLPDTSPLQQAQDVARALATAQRRAAAWGADPNRFVLMGHSAGAHLVALLTARPELASEQGARPWRGTVSLDSACLDVVQTMRGRHFPLYDQAFGTNPADWLAASPYQHLAAAPAPFLAVCSSRRRDACPQAHAFVDKLQSLGARGRVLEEDLSHGEINKTLGEPSDYTTEVDAFLRSVW